MSTSPKRKAILFKIICLVLKEMGIHSEDASNILGGLGIVGRISGSGKHLEHLSSRRELRCAPSSLGNTVPQLKKLPFPRTSIFIAANVLRNRNNPITGPGH